MEAEEMAIRSAGATLSPGDSVRINCPACYKPGGERQSMLVSRNDYRIYGHCFRNSCGFARYVLANPLGEFPTTNAAALAELRPYTGSYGPPTTADIDWMIDMLPDGANRRASLLGLYMGRTLDRAPNGYLIEIHKPFPTCAVVGRILRRPWPGSPLGSEAQPWHRPKVLTYREAQGPLLAWYGAANLDGGIDELLIVEDPLSAMRVWLGWDQPTVALLGTQLTKEGVSQLQRYAKRVVMALDADATETAFDHARKWGSAFERFRVRILERDYKDMKTAEITESLRS